MSEKKTSLQFAHNLVSQPAENLYTVVLNKILLKKSASWVGNVQAVIIVIS